MADKSASLTPLLLWILVATAGGQSCKPVPLDTPTRWGGNEAIEIDQRDHPVRTAHGIVSLAADTEFLADVLLQVYERNHTDPLYRAPEPGDPLPIAACITGDDGAFRFLLPRGEYELRASMNTGMDVTHIYFAVRRGLHRSRRISVTISPGT